LDVDFQAMQFSTANAEAAKQLKSLLKPVTDDKQRNESTNRHSIGNAVDATGRKRTHQVAVSYQIVTIYFSKHRVVMMMMTMRKMK
jgi:hypothetical protein